MSLEFDAIAEARKKRLHKELGESLEIRSREEQQRALSAQTELNHEREGEVELVINRFNAPNGMAGSISFKGPMTRVRQGPMHRGLNDKPFVLDGNGKRDLLGFTHEQLVAMRRIWGLESEDYGFLLDGRVLQSSDGSMAIRAIQTLRGITVHSSCLSTRFLSDGSLRRVFGDVYRAREEVGTWSSSLGMAVNRLMVHLAAELVNGGGRVQKGAGEQMAELKKAMAGHVPGQVKATADPMQSGRGLFEVVPFEGFPGRILAQRAWLPIDGDLSPAWDLRFTIRGLIESYQAMAHGGGSGGLLSLNSMDYPAQAWAKVHICDWAEGTRVLPMPANLPDHGIPLDGKIVKDPGNPPRFPRPWTNDRRTSGDLAIVHFTSNALAEDLDPEPPVAANDNRGELAFFNLPDAEAEGQCAVDAFYRACFLHDHFHILGFRSEDGAFEGNDPMHVHVVREMDDARDDAGFFLTYIDGESGVILLHMQGVKDPTIIAHEYAHGLTFRLLQCATGRPGRRQVANAILHELQSNALKEGIADYLACAVTGEDEVGGQYARLMQIRSGLPRRVSDRGEYEHTYGEIYSLEDEYQCGTIMASALRTMDAGIKSLDLERDLSALTQVLLVNALKIHVKPVNPSFLDLRDGIILALKDMHREEVLDDIEYHNVVERFSEAFTSAGMGRLATSDHLAREVREDTEHGLEDFIPDVE